MIPSGWGGVLALFTIPVGGGIPAGVVLAKSRGVGVPAMEFLYFVSDCVLALAFEPVMHGLLALARRVPALAKFKQLMKQVVLQTTELWGARGGPLTLIFISFAVDPMTGRASTHAAGHGFFSGWALSIAGDMIYFSVIMASTLWLNAWLGDGFKTVVIITVAMFVIPSLVKRWRQRGRGGAPRVA